MADVRDEELAKLIGLNITNRLIAFDRTQQDLADYLGASKSTVSMWVNGKRTPLMRTIDQICKYFGCTREDIMRDNREGYQKHSVSIPVYARVAAGLPHIRIHDYRHHMVSALHAAGISDAYIQQRGGWASDYTLKAVYRHTLADHEQDAVEATNAHFDALMGGDSTC